MSFLTWYATERSLQNSTTDGSFEEPDFHYPLLGNAFSLVFGIINILVGTAYIVEECVRLSFQRMPLKRTSVVNPYSNLAFRVFFIVFGLSLIIDFICAASFVWYENYTLMLAVFIGWFLMLFFLRAFRPFSFFTIMIQNVLVGDLLRFAVILICELIAFSTVMFMAMQGASEVDSEYSNYGRVLLSMFKLMVGLGDVGLIYQTRHPALSILILVGFIILTTLLMINSLIAMISRTSTELVEEAGLASARDIHWKLQRLSLVLYIESVLPRRFVYLGGMKEDKKWYNNRTKHWKSMPRYRLEIRSLQNADNALRSDEADMLNNKWGLDTKFDFTEYLRSLSVDPGRDKVGHYDQKSVAEHEKYPINDEQFSTKGEATWGLQTTRSLGSTIKSHVHVYDHHICDKCETVTDLDKK